MPTTWVQEHFHPGTSIPLIGVLVSLVYCSHFLVMPTVAVVLWIRNRPRFLIWMRMVIALAVAGRGDVLPLPDGTALARRQRRGLPRPARRALHLRGLRPDRPAHGRRHAQPGAVPRQPGRGHAVAAHGVRDAGGRVLLVRQDAGGRRRCSPATRFAMGFSLLYGGEHYVVDEIAGAAYALAVIAGWRLLRRRRVRSGVAVSPDPSW